MTTKNLARQRSSLARQPYSPQLRSHPLALARSLIVEGDGAKETGWGEGVWVFCNPKSTLIDMTSASGHTPARPLLDYRQARFTHRLLARTQGGESPEEILTRDEGATVRRLRAAAGTRTGETVEPQVWEECRTFPGGFTIDDKGPAKETAQNWRRTGPIWTDGSRMDSGAVGAACAWQTEEGWTGRRFHLGTNKEVFDAEVYAIYQALRTFEERQETGKKYTVFSDCQPAIRRALSDAIGPCQQWARAIIDLATRLIGRRNEVLILWVPAHVGVGGNEVADRMVKEAAAGQIYGVATRLGGRQASPPVEESHGASVGGYLPVDQGACQTGAPLRPPRRPGLPKKGNEEGAQVGRPALQPAALGLRGDRLLFA